jgi:hypothetical protein
MRALSIRQPYAELILRGIKTAELRTISTRIVGERFYIYAAKAKAVPPVPPVPIWSNDLQVATPPAWMIELAAQVKLIEPELLRGVVLPTGVIVGTAVIGAVIPPDPSDAPDGGDEAGRRGLFRWTLHDVRRLATPRKPTGHPQPVWFVPF